MEPLSLVVIKERFRASYVRKAQALTVLLSNPSSVSVCQQAEIDRQEANQELDLLNNLEQSLFALEGLDRE